MRTFFTHALGGARAHGERLPTCDPTALVAALTCQRQGLSVMARAGVPPDTLARCAQTALALSPAA